MTEKQITITGPLSDPHSVTTCYGSRIHCIPHGTDEPDQPCYRACLECRHVWRSAAELLAEHNRIGRQAEPGCVDETVPARVFSCPLCCHDF